MAISYERALINQIADVTRTLNLTTGDSTIISQTLNTQERAVNLTKVKVLLKDLFPQYNFEIRFVGYHDCCPNPMSSEIEFHSLYEVRIARVS